MNKASDISVVIPTKDRLKSLQRTLESINTQTLLPKEVIIVDSSISKLTYDALPKLPKGITLIIKHTKPSVCLQRNMGIELSLGKYILLCDDDFEISENYISKLSNYLETHPEINIVSGLILEKNNNTWKYQQPSISPLNLIYRYLFSLSIWGSVNFKVYPQWYLRGIVNHYKKLGNTISKAGWPIISDFENDVILTRIYSLGISLFKAEKLKQHPFDLSFEEHGIGDNYDLALQINGIQKTHVLKNAKVYHHKETDNRLPTPRSFFYRAQALRYILRKHKNHFNKANRFWFSWSMFGHLLYFLAKGNLQMAKASFKALKIKLIKH